LAVAVIVAVAFDVTATVVIVKVAVVAPASTVTAAGTVAAALLDVRLTESPPVGAALDRVTVAVELVPPTSEVGLSARPVTVGAFTLKFELTVV